ncbi:hypothetical protein PLANPX_5712 [Lacipirellula parvula]|uniref:Uncharacterized protein n=1 Tax=Lacipirellula parvula TaxID=2650471 RepID=A0A5K7XGV6_9BACT|nr:hypothetical protein PLANPX_5712 [Lacipirellula parvula]
MEVYSALNKELQHAASSAKHYPALLEMADASSGCKLAACREATQAIDCQRLAGAENHAKATCPSRRRFLYSAPSPQTPLRASRCPRSG